MTTDHVDSALNSDGYPADRTTTTSATRRTSAYSGASLNDSPPLLPPVGGRTKRASLEEAPADLRWRQPPQ